METHCSILTWESPWMEEPGRLTVHGVTKMSDMTYQLNNNNKTANYIVSDYE